MIRAVTGHVANGRMRALGLTSTKRSKVMPQLATIEEQGVPGYELGAWFGVYAPAATPAPVIKTLNDTITRALSVPRRARISSPSRLIRPARWQP